MSSREPTLAHLPGFGADFYVGLVRALGTDLSDVISALEMAFRTAGYRRDRALQIIKLSTFFDELLESAKPSGASDPLVRLSAEEEGRFAYYCTRMDAGDALRERFGGDILAQRAIADVRVRRPKGSGHRGTVFVFDSLMHPDEVALLRSIYGRRFFLIAVHSTADHRAQWLYDDLRSTDPESLSEPDWSDLAPDERDRRAEERSRSLNDRCREQVADLMERDEGVAEPLYLSPGSPGRRVAIRRTFSAADVFVTLKEAGDARSQSRKGVVQRFVEKLFDEPFDTPTRAELGMAHAYVAARRSGSLARAVGAAICTPQGDVLAVGTNDVPAAGGGHYWPFYDGADSDFREHLHEWTLPSGEKVIGDSNDQVKLELFVDLLSRAFSSMTPEVISASGNPTLFDRLKIDPEAVITKLFQQDNVRAARFFDVIEFSRTVHAEMSALMSCLRNGISTEGMILYCTTFPCHECSRHIIAAGISRVVYVEPFAKSRVGSLHDDAVVIERFTGPPPLEDELRGASEDDRVRFEPFIGFSPNRHEDLYSVTTRKIDGAIANPEYLGRKRHWLLGPTSPVRASLASPRSVALMAEELMVQSSESYIARAMEEHPVLRG